MKTIEELLKARKTFKRSAAGMTPYTVPFKEAVIAYHFNSGVVLREIANRLDIGEQIAYKWKRTYGKDMTGYIHGSRIRYDVRTKCLAIQDELEHGLSVIQIANKYKITRSQYYSWKTLFKDRYKDHVENMTDGVPYLVKTKKHVYGSKNIEIVQEVLNDEMKELQIVIVGLQKYGAGSVEMDAMQKKLDARKLILEDM